ncbi:probable WRKY transcription factor 20 isoform X6 [Salvia hispanica]|uniref:probable WRKY transcription factor 20 isoform X6 n=1 Tax=Salvia hispanica TaxID=49212 RepID=UPI0020097474|nr:probable WRKY transcription factor 20 isoform X6 [Salvia hispanica]
MEEEDRSHYSYPHVTDAGGSTNGARYRLMSPGKLPISRSTCITIPPGLSPTSFLDSPVLLSNIKAEPSPTTGSFFKPQLMQASVENGAILLEKKSTSGNVVVDEKTSSGFEFRFHTGVSTTSGLSSAGMSSNTGAQVSVSEHKDSSSPVSAERTSGDGYNWRKYGQKLVRGKIVYKGLHDHPKPQSARRHNPGALMSIQEDKVDKGLSLAGQEDKMNTDNMEKSGSPMLSPLQTNEGMDGSGSQFQGQNDDAEDDDLVLKRRKIEDGIDVTLVVKPIREPRVVVQTVSEVDILDDGYRWRKYGQKVVRGNPNPRSYYKCTNAGCPVRKHVERASHDPKAVITTYEGKHNHDVPVARNSSHELAGTTGYAGTSKMRAHDSSSLISLNLGVGIGRAGEHKSEKGLDGEGGQRQNNPVYEIVNVGLNLYGNREAHNFEMPPVNASNQCQQNLRRILMGP